MKSPILILFAIIGFSYVQAQNFVSTSPENKNVVLEEFTGIDCTYCPDGHKKANAIKAANPNDVVLINIHEGSYAVPDFAGDPEYRTLFGQALVSQSGLTGYPSGTVNRHIFTGGKTATSRNLWQTYANQTLAQASPVNVAAQATIDMATRELVVVVETYFTAAAAAAPYKLNVVLLQDSLQSAQTGASTYNPTQVLPNGKYLHMHMLRHMLTGQWGLDIASTSSGYFQSDTIRYTIPIALGYPGSISPLIPVDLSDIEVAVFVAEGQQEIITGNTASLTEIPAPVPSSPVSMNARVIKYSTAPTGLCFDSFSPEVVVTNTGTNTINSFAINYGIFGEPMTPHVVNTPLNVGQSTVVALPAVTLPSTGIGSYLYYEVDFVNYNANAVNTNNNDDFDTEYSFATFGSAAPTSTAMTEGFQGYGIGVGAPTGTIADNPNDIRAYTATKAIGGLSQNLGGFGNSDGCFRWDFYAITSGQSSTLTYNKINLSNTSNTRLAFAHAHAQEATENDRFKINISTDCGQTWTTVWNKAGAQLATAPALSGSRFYPLVTEWVADTVDLSAYDGQGEVFIQLEGVSAHGNSLYLDDFNTFQTIITGIEDLKEVAQAALSIMPNPVRNQMTIQFDLPETAEVNMTIYNALGQQVQNVTTGTFEGTNTIQVNTQKLTAGVYLLNLASDKGLVTKRFTVKK